LEWHTFSLADVILELPSAYFDYFGMGILVGILLTFVGLVGWAKQLGKQKRQQFAAFAFFTPWLGLILGYLDDGLNLHGSAVLVISLILLGTILAIILLIMAAAANQN
jgi:hypothetical protein